MEKIKFRAWDEYNKKWIYFSLESLFSDLLGRKKRPEIVELWHARNYELKIYRFTGLKDKDDKEICEGDIIKSYRNSIEYSGLIKYSSEYLDYRVFTYPEHCFLRLNEFYPIEIIGNIHENPELMKEQKNASI